MNGRRFQLFDRVSRRFNIANVSLVLALFCPFAPPVKAQSYQTWPEISTYVKLTQNTRFYFIATQTKENRQGTDAEIGPNVDFYLKPLVKWRRITVFNLDKSKSAPLLLRVGYRYLPSSGGATEHRAVLEATGRYALKSGFLFSNRCRADLRFIEGTFSWRYRDRLTMERTVSILSYHFSPYVRGEAYFDSNYEKWSRTSETAGITFPIRKHTEFELYYEHQNDSGKSPNRQINALGIALNLYF
jgi:hypothetical protein